MGSVLTQIPLLSRPQLSKPSKARNIFDDFSLSEIRTWPGKFSFSVVGSHDHILLWGWRISAMLLWSISNWADISPALTPCALLPVSKCMAACPYAPFHRKSWNRYVKQCIIQLVIGRSFHWNLTFTKTGLSTFVYQSAELHILEIWSVSIINNSLSISLYPKMEPAWSVL